MKRFPTACLLALLTTTAFAEPKVYKAGELSIVAPWTQELPPGAPTAAVYFELRNQGLEDDTLTGVDTPIAGIAELHRPISQDGMMKMGQMQGVTIPAGGWLSTGTLTTKSPALAKCKVSSNCCPARSGLSGMRSISMA